MFHNLNSIIFPDSLPKIDLHGLDRVTAQLMIRDFICDSKKQKQSFILIIHGVGSGILYKTTMEVLKRHCDVLDFKQLNMNHGCTIVNIKV